ncbi:MAG: hypothetical protein A3K19_33485 [Lentisphaerae bacterium RIFOXYB12_FULL_65_16]|nr:MAG: hypothetical protein A3K18_05970 [Lentisphaerae bacterium RIFOXYA12_64_32]OGV86942.1 MAG: hypothetical protein A3K19_33485 [Lentisphaerae bacterium RIFOXYB12_FULL_65_16]
MADAATSVGATQRGGHLGQARWAAFVAWAFVVLLFGAYPIALACPMGLQTELVFHFSIPTLFLLALMTIACLLLGRLHDIRPLTHHAPARGRFTPGARTLTAAAVFFAAVCILSAWHGRTAAWHELVILIGYITIPLFYATCPRRWMPRHLVRVLAILWLLNLLHCFWQYTVAGHEMVGLAGNRNWLAALTVVLTPWVWLAVAQWRPKHPEADAPCADRGRWLRWALYAGSTYAALILLKSADCRATWLGLGAYVCLFLVLPRLSTFLAAVIGGLIPILVIACFAFLPEAVIHSAESDIRLPMYASTVRLIADHPVLGVGAGNYRRDYARYRSLAHKSRFVAAPVTEHPHNEVLHVAASAGVPVALLWCLLFLPLLRPARGNTFWHLVHFSAFMMVAHSMFDKVLVQPPTCVLGFFFLGILWRPRRRVRWRPHLAATSGRRWATLAVLIAAAGCGLYVAVREARTSWFFRQAFILEANNHFQEAYQDYARTTIINPGCVQTHAYSGIIANNKLRDPLLALKHLDRARQLEPDFAHINGEIGLALGSLRRHAEALPFFQREAQLYPFDVIAHQRLFLCGLVTGRVPEMDALFERIAWLRYRGIIQHLGEEDANQHVAEFMIALEKDQPKKAVAVAEEMLAPLGAGTAEPAFFQLAQQTGVPTGIYNRPFGEFDYDYWRRLLLWRRLLRERDTPTVPDLLEQFRGLSTPPNDRRNRAAEFAEFASQAGSGIEVGVLRKPDGTDLGVVEIRQGTSVWLASLTTGQVRPDADAVSLQRDPTAQAALNLKPEDVTSLVIALPAWPLEFWTRHQALGQVLRLAAGNPAPKFGTSPGLRRRHYERALAAALVQKPKTGEAAASDASSFSPITVEFDAQCFRSFALLLPPPAQEGQPTSDARPVLPP